MLTRQQFYKSKKWEAFRKVIINQRTDPDGNLYCAVCGKPILKQYDLIVHHKQELSEANVNDVMVSLNPDNVECIHFKCHNKIHERFGFSHSKQVFIVYGSPCSGKSSWVQSVADPDDLIVDVDSIWQMISINERYKKPDQLKSVVFEMRDKMYDIIKYRSGKWKNAYIIITGALKGDRDRLKVRVAADDLIFIDTPHDVCLNRASDRGESSKEWIKYVNDWFDSFQPEQLTEE